MPLPERINSSESVIRHPSRFLRGWIADLRSAFPLGAAIARRDFQARYRQTLFGYAWAVLPAIAAAAAFTVMQSSNLLNVGDTGIPYPAFAFLGALFWQLFASALMGAMDMVQNSRSILGKVYFPRDALLVAALLLTGLELVIRLAVLPFVLLAFGIMPGANLMFLPLIIFVTIMLGFSIGVVLVPISLVYQDVRLLVQVVLSALIVVTPVGYVAPKAGVMGFLVSHNPLTPLVEAGRASLSTLPMPDASSILWVSGVAVALVFLAVPFFHIALPIVVERQSA